MAATVASVDTAVSLLVAVTEGFSSRQRIVVSFSGGYTRRQLFVDMCFCYAYTFDDIIVLPGHINFGIDEGNVSSCCCVHGVCNV
jgi:hypothetical protein